MQRPFKGYATHVEDGDATTVVAQGPLHPEYGWISMKFTANPIELRQWIITDENGAQMTVVLGFLDPVEQLQPSLLVSRWQ